MEKLDKNPIENKKNCTWYNLPTSNNNNINNEIKQSKFRVNRKEVTYLGTKIVNNSKDFVNIKNRIIQAKKLFVNKKKLLTLQNNTKNS